jgi:hypothetical protein
MPCIHQIKGINYSKQKVIIECMRSVIITPHYKKEFDLAFSLMIEFGRERKRLSLDDGGDISFVFLMKEIDNPKEVSGKIIAKKIMR